MSALLRLVLVAWLAFAFGFGQQAAALHALGHAMEQAGDEPLVPEKCPDHSLFTGVADGLGVGHHGAACLTPDHVRPSSPPAAAPALPARFSFHSRAPPLAS